MTQSTRLRLFRTILAGCDLHPGYQAKKQPRVACASCKEMWAARLSLREGILDNGPDKPKRRGRG